LLGRSGNEGVYSMTGINQNVMNNLEGSYYTSYGMGSLNTQGIGITGYNNSGNIIGEVVK